MQDMELPGVQALRSWLLQHVCPFWFDRVLEPTGGFHEALDGQSRVVRSDERSILNQARLTYVASHAYLLGGDEGMLRIAGHGFAFIQKACQEQGPQSGWPRRLKVDGSVLDGARDAYDHAFIIFALAFYYRATGSREALELAGLAFDFMQAFLADAQGGGYFEEYPATGKLPRRQNPHMHLLEALLAMHAATQEQRWLLEARRVLQLFEARFTDSQTGALAEYFSADWSPSAGEAGGWREPGHQFEWVWLLGQYGAQSGDQRYQPMAERLFAFGSRFGIDRHDLLGGAVLDGLDQQGRLVADTKLFWPQTEYIKACVQKAEDNPADRAWRTAAWAHTRLLRRHFFRADDANWCNQLTQTGEPAVDQTPSRVLYHLFLAMAELIRLEELA